MTLTGGAGVTGVGVLSSRTPSCHPCWPMPAQGSRAHDLSGDSGLSLLYPFSTERFSNLRFPVALYFRASTVKKRKSHLI